MNKKKAIPTLEQYRGFIDRWVKGHWWDLFGTASNKEGQGIIIFLLMDILDELKKKQK